MAATIIDVQLAMRENNREEAVRLLQEVLRQSPSADAWHLAAQLTKNRDERIRHLRRALNYDPQHKGALQMLDQMGAAHSGGASDLLADVRQSLRDEGSRSWLVRWLPRPVQGVAIIVLILGMVVAVGYGIFTLVQEFTPPEIPTDLTPIASEFEELNPDTLATQLRRTGLRIASVVRIDSEEVVNGDLMRVSFLGASGTLRTAEIIIYASLGVRLQARDYLDTLATTNTLVPATNAVLIYPNDMPNEDAQLLREAFAAVNG